MVVCQTRKKQEGIKDLHKKNHSTHGYSSEGLNINKASSSNHKSDIKKQQDVTRRRVSLD